LGHGRHDIVYLPGNATQLDVMWEHSVVEMIDGKVGSMAAVIGARVRALVQASEVL